MPLELSLFQIEAGIRDLYAMREEAREAIAAAVSSDNTIEQDAEVLAELVVIDNTIREYLRAEIRKVDGVADFLLMLDRLAHEPRVRKGVNERCEIDLEIDRLRARRDKLRETAKSAEEQVKFVMEEMPWREGKPKKLEGVRHSLTLRGNGGAQPVEITDESLVPDEYCRFTVTFSGVPMAPIIEFFAGDEHVKMGPREVSKSAVSEALAKACEECEGSGEKCCNPDHTRPTDCTEKCRNCIYCGGTGLCGVPGARLLPRGSSIQIK